MLVNSYKHKSFNKSRFQKRDLCIKKQHNFQETEEIGFFLDVRATDFGLGHHWFDKPNQFGTMKIEEEHCWLTRIHRSNIPLYKFFENFSA